MPEQINDVLLNVVVGVTLLGSVATCVAIGFAWTRGSRLTFRRRRPVPWNAVVALPLVLLAISSAVSVNRESPTHVTEEKTATAVESDGRQANDGTAASGGAALPLLFAAVVELSIVGSVLLLTRAYFDATLADFGLHPRPRAVVKDVFIGIVVGVAALAPIRLVQAALLIVCGMPVMESGHPLVKMLRDSPPGVLVMISASFMAMVVAPVCEEITFRLLFQGWLEKWDRNRMKGRRAGPIDSWLTGSQPQVPIDNTETPHQPPPQTELLPFRGTARLAFGFVPIVISSVLFGFAHFGYGPEPVSMFFLALMLGYVYFRTHSIVPCIVAHMLFNSFTMFVLWRLWMLGAS